MNIPRGQNCQRNVSSSWLQTMWAGVNRPRDIYQLFISERFWNGEDTYQHEQRSPVVAPSGDVVPLISLVKDQVPNLNSRGIFSVLRRRLFMQTNSCRTFYSKKVSIRSQDYLWHQLQVTPPLKRDKSTSRSLGGLNPRRSLRWLSYSTLKLMISTCSNCSTCNTYQWFAPSGDRPRDLT